MSPGLKATTSLEADEIHLDIKRGFLVMLVGGGQVIAQLSHHCNQIKLKNLKNLSSLIGSVVDPDPEFWPKLDRGLDPGLC